MRPALMWCLAILVPSLAQAAEGGTARLPLEEWQRVVDFIADAERKPEPEHPYAIVARSLDVTFARGVLSGTMDVDVDVDTTTTPLAVPLLDERASLTSVTVDGARAVATRSLGMNAVLVGKNGHHRIRVAFALGQDDDRFTRSFALSLPLAPATRVTAELPERDIDVEVEAGVILERAPRGTGTHVIAAIGNRDGVVFTWHRRIADGAETKRELEARAYVLASVQEQSVRMRTALVYRVLAGEAGRFTVDIPDGLEVTQVVGDAVLQWTTEGNARKRSLVVLLKYLVATETSIVVWTQHPRGDGARAELLFLRPSDAPLREGFVALEGRAGFELAVDGVANATEVAARDLPSAMLEMTDKPLLSAYRYVETPKLGVLVTRNAQVELTQAVIDSLEAVTVVGEDGVEITKLKLRVRNNTRQYLSVTLPPNAVVTHALIDGAPIQPAFTTDNLQIESVLIPLRQSERLTSTGASSIGESSFVIELAYKTAQHGLGAFGRRHLILPTMDIPVIAVDWDTYVPNAYEPLIFATDLTQHDGIHDDPLTRLRHFLRAVLSVRSAWAGGDYSNILRSRKSIYAQEQKKQTAVALAAFPLVGQPYHFNRVLLGERRAEIAMTYLRKSVQPWIRGLVFVGLALLSIAYMRIVRATGFRASLRSRTAVGLLAAIVVTLIVGHSILGVYRSALWAFNVALAFTLIRDVVRRQPAPARTRPLLGIRWFARLALFVLVAGFLATFPLLWGLTLFALLLGRSIKHSAEVQHG